MRGELHTTTGAAVFSNHDGQRGTSTPAESTLPREDTLKCMLPAATSLVERHRRSRIATPRSSATRGWVERTWLGLAAGMIALCAAFDVGAQSMPPTDAGPVAANAEPVATDTQPVAAARAPAGPTPMPATTPTPAATSATAPTSAPGARASLRAPNWGLLRSGVALLILGYGVTAAMGSLVLVPFAASGARGGAEEFSTWLVPVVGPFIYAPVAAAAGHVGGAMPVVLGLGSLQLTGLALLIASTVTPGRAPSPTDGRLEIGTQVVPMLTVAGFFEPRPTLGGGGRLTVGYRQADGWTFGTAIDFRFARARSEAAGTGRGSVGGGSFVTDAMVGAVVRWRSTPPLRVHGLLEGSIGLGFAFAEYGDAGGATGALLATAGGGVAVDLAPPVSLDVLARLEGVVAGNASRAAVVLGVGFTSAL